MVILGITGKSGSGKTTVARLLKRRAWTVVDVDRLAQDLYVPGQRAHRALGKIFGAKVYAADGTIDRQWLGHEVFTKPRRLKQLNDLMFPLVLQRMRQAIAKARREKVGKLAFDMAVLFQASAQGLMQAVILVEAPLALRLARLKAGRGLSRARAHQQARALDFKPEWRGQAQLILKNQGQPHELALPLTRFLSSLRGPKPTDDSCR